MSAEGATHPQELRVGMKIYWQYFKYVIRHKWWVMYYCYLDGLIWRGITHDWHKFLPSEYFPYANFFYGKKVRDKTGYYKPTDTGDSAFDFAWLLHQKRADHHWQWWVLPEDDGGVKIIAMSDKARREMICDWKGAGKAQGTPDTLKWWIVNNHKMQLHPDTKKWIEKHLPPTALRVCRTAGRE